MLLPTVSQFHPPPPFLRPSRDGVVMQASMGIVSVDTREEAEAIIESLVPQYQTDVSGVPPSPSRRPLDTCRRAPISAISTHVFWQAEITHCANLSCQLGLLYHKDGSWSSHIAALHEFSACFHPIWQFFHSFTPISQWAMQYGVLMLLYSAVLTRGCKAVESDQGFDAQPLITLPFGHAKWEAPCLPSPKHH